MDIIRLRCNQMARNAYNRVYSDSNYHRKSYKHLKKPYGFKTVLDMADYLFCQFYTEIKSLIEVGEHPSVDRIKSGVGYSKGNVRIISHHLNSVMGAALVKKKVKCTYPDGKVIVFESVTKCAESFGVAKNNIKKVSCWIAKNGQYKIPEGCKFQYVVAI